MNKQVYCSQNYLASVISFSRVRFQLEPVHRQRLSFGLGQGFLESWMTGDLFFKILEDLRALLFLLFSLGHHGFQQFPAPVAAHVHPKRHIVVELLAQFARAHFYIKIGILWKKSNIAEFLALPDLPRFILCIISKNQSNYI